MLIDKTHLGWGLASAAALGVCAAGYAISTAGAREASGGSVAGLTFGALALGTMIFAGLLAVRKKFPGLRLGSAQFWLRGHIWLGLLSVPLAFFHSGFRFGGALEQAFMFVFLVVIASGVFGLVMQQVLPRVLKVRVPLETFPQQIPQLCQQFQEESDKLVASLKNVAKRAGPGSLMRTAGAVSAAPPAKAGGGLAKPVDKEALAAKLASMKGGAAKPAGEATTAKAPVMKGVAAKGVDKEAIAAKIAMMKSAAAAKAAGETPNAAPVEAPAAGAGEGSAAPAGDAAGDTAAPPPADAGAKPAPLDKAAFLAQVAAKKAAMAKAKSDAVDASAPAAVAPEGAAKAAPLDKAAFLAQVAAKKAAMAQAKAEGAGAGAPVTPGKPPAADKAALLAQLAAKKSAPAKGAASAGAASPSSQASGPSSLARAEAGMPRLSLLLRFYEKEVRPFFSADERTAARQRVASQNYARMAFANLAAELPSQALETIERLEELVDERRQFLVQVRIQRWLRTWLLVHVPLSAALFVLAALHIVVALRVVPWS